MKTYKISMQNLETGKRRSALIVSDNLYQAEKDAYMLFGNENIIIYLIERAI